MGITLALITVALIFILAALVACFSSTPGLGDLHWHRLTDDKSLFLDSGGWRLHYLDMGGSGPVVLMVHGFADSVYTWCKNVEPLMDHGFRVILIDLPGMGQSDIPPRGYLYSMENQASAVIRLADALHLNKFSVIGSSMGGGIALYLSLQYAARIDKVIVLDPACFAFPLSRQLRFILLPGISRLIELFSCRWTLKIALEKIFFNSSLVDTVMVDEYSKPFSKKGYKKIIRSLALDYYSEKFHAMAKQYAQHAIKPLIIWGAEDRLISVGYGRKLQRILTGASLTVVKACGHLPHQERPDEVNPLMIEFLKP